MLSDNIILISRAHTRTIARKAFDRATARGLDVLRAAYEARRALVEYGMQMERERVSKKEGMK